MNKIIQCRNLSKQYHDGETDVKVLHHLDIDIDAGELVAIVGSSGSGKSTLLHLLGGLDMASDGQVLIDNTDLSGLSISKQAQFRNDKIGFIYQFHHLLMEFNAVENVAMPLLIGGMDAKLARQKAEALLERVGMSHRLSHRPSQLSGGERQRVAIARAVVTEPALVLADEPTGNLDHSTAEQIFELICELNASLNTCFVVVTHDLQLAAKMGRQLHLVDGKLEA